MKKFFTVLFFLISISLIMGQTNYYVSTSGDDANDGSIGSPWATIQHALQNIANPSVTNILNVADGTYTESGITDNNRSGDYANLTIQGSSSLNVIVQANASANTATDRVFNFSGGSKITINNMLIRILPQANSICMKPPLP